MAIFCENCGTQLDDNARFCAGCGHATEPQQAAPAPPPVIQQANTPAAPPRPAAPPQVAPAPPPPVQPVYQAQADPPGKGGGKKPSTNVIVAVIVIAVLVVALIAACVIFIPKILGGGETPAGPSAPAGPVTPAPQDSAADDETPAPVQEREPEQPAPTKPNYAGDEMPTIGDFFWFTETDSFPADRTVITDFSEITGLWKAYEVSKTSSPEEAKFLKFFNAEIGGEAGQLTFTYRMANSSGFDEETGNTVDISLQDGEIYKGNFDNGALTAGDITTKGVQILIGEFYYHDGRQYAYGVELYIDGDSMYIALVRP